MRAAILCLVVAVGVTSASASDQAKAATTYDGTWSGTTTQDSRKISFKVTEGVVRQLAVEWQVPLDGPCSAGSGLAMTSAGGSETFYFYPNSPGAEPPPIAAKAFKLERKQFRSNPAINLVLTGEFLSGSDAKGSLELSAAGSGCKGAAKATWTARREAAK